jgi:serine/threonine protein kinase
VGSSDEGGSEATFVRDPLIGATVIGYEIVKPIGLGGMGKVYEAVERNIGRRAAVKVLLPEAASDPTVVARLKAEARAANAIGHPGIIDIFGFAELPDGRHAIVMEFLDGTPLDELLRRSVDEGRLLPLREALTLLEELAAVLAASHGAGVVHRDLKPSNIFLLKRSDGSRTLKVLDFGIAKSDKNAAVKTQLNTVLGTPAYIAPEQIAGSPASPSMDLYAFGVIAFEVFTGRLPFEHDNLMTLLMMHQQRAAPAPSSVVPTLPRVIDELVLKMLEKDPRDRFPSAEAMRDRLRALRREVSDPEALPTSPGLLTPRAMQVQAGSNDATRRNVKVASQAAPAGFSTTQVRKLRGSPWRAVAVGGVVAVGVGAAWLLASRDAPGGPAPKSGPGVVVAPPPEPPKGPDDALAPPRKPEVKGELLPVEVPVAQAPVEPVPGVGAERPPEGVMPEVPQRPSPAVKPAASGGQREAVARRIERLQKRLEKLEAEQDVRMELKKLAGLDAMLESASAKDLLEISAALRELERENPP